MNQKVSFSINILCRLVSAKIKYGKTEDFSDLLFNDLADSLSKLLTSAQLALLIIILKINTAEIQW